MFFLAAPIAFLTSRQNVSVSDRGLVDKQTGHAFVEHRSHAVMTINLKYVPAILVMLSLIILAIRIPND